MGAAQGFCTNNHMHLYDADNTESSIASLRYGRELLNDTVEIFPVSYI